MADLLLQIAGRRHRNTLQQLMTERRFLIKHPPGMTKGLAATSLDHVGEDRPGGTGKADQGDAVAQFALRYVQGVVDVGEFARRVRWIAEGRHVRRRPDRFGEAGADLFDHIVVQPQRLGNHEDVAEDDCRVDL